MNGPTTLAPVVETPERLPKAEYRAKRRAERAAAKAERLATPATCRSCGRPMPGIGICSRCYSRGVR